MKAVAQPSGCGKVTVSVTLADVSSGPFTLQVDFANALQVIADKVEDWPAALPQDATWVSGYLSINRLMLISACLNPMPGMDLHEEFPGASDGRGSFQKCGASVGWDGPVKNLGGITTNDTGEFVDNVSVAVTSSSALNPVPTCPGVVNGNCDPPPTIPAGDLSPQANAFGTQLWYIGSKKIDIVNLGKYVVGATDRQVRYTDHGRNAPANWVCPVQ